MKNKFQTFLLTCFLFLQRAILPHLAARIELDCLFKGKGVKKTQQALAGLECRYIELSTIWFLDAIIGTKYSFHLNSPLLDLSFKTILIPNA